MRWAVGYTLHPGKSYLQCSVRIVNRTPVANTMLCFANVAVHANDQYQVIFPPSTQFVTFHGKREFTTWPIATTRFNGVDFSRGVDVSWYKNHPNAMSMFAWNYDRRFLRRLRSRQRSRHHQRGRSSRCAGQKILDLGQRAARADVGQNPDRRRWAVHRTDGRGILRQSARLQLAATVRDEIVRDALVSVSRFGGREAGEPRRRGEFGDCRWQGQGWLWNNVGLSIGPRGVESRREGSVR